VPRAMRRSRVVFALVYLATLSACAACGHSSTADADACAACDAGDSARSDAGCGDARLDGGTRGAPDGASAAPRVDLSACPDEPGFGPGCCAVGNFCGVMLTPNACFVRMAAVLDPLPCDPSRPASLDADPADEDAGR